jgi:apolipoprotein N-acyltransferase
MAVAGVQPGRVGRGDERFDAHLELSRELEGRDDLGLVVWAESSVGFDLAERPDALAELEDLAALLGAPVLVNVDARRGEGGIFKSSVLVGPDGVEARYDKRRLVPFGEYVPARSLLGWMSSVTDAAEENRRRGDALVVMDLEVPGPSGDELPVGLGPLVCFESAFPDLTRELARRGADLMVLQTATTTFQGSWAQDQHAALGAVRAVETGRPVVHAAVSGVSAVFDAEGHELTRLDNDSTGVWVAEVPLAGGTTPYVRWGDWVPAACVVVLVAAALAAGLRAARREGRGPAAATP